MPDLKTCKRWVDDYIEASDAHRARAYLRRDYRCGIQWTAEEKKTLADRGQPEVTFNVFGEKCGTMTGAEALGETVPHAVGRNAGQDQATAAVVTASIRYVTDEADWENERILGRDQLFVEGVVGTSIGIRNPGADIEAQTYRDGEMAAGMQMNQGNPEITVNHIPYGRLFWDPKSIFADFRDAKYFGTMVWLDLDEALAQYPSKEEILKASVQAADPADDAFEDKPEHWVQGSDRKRLRIATCWYRERGDWYLAVYVEGGFLDEPRISPYLDDRNRTIPGMVIGSVVVSREENERVAPSQDLVSPQDELNKRRSKALYLMNAWNVIADEGAFADTHKALESLNKGHGVVFKRPGAQVEVVNRQAQIIDNMQLMADARAAFETLGPAAGLVGEVSGGASGVAIERRQSAALLKFGDYLRAAKKWELSVYRHIWFRIRQFWTAEDYIRVTEDDNAEQYLEVNKQVTMADVLIQRGVDPSMLQQMQASGMLQAQGIDVSEVVAVQNHLQQLDVDVILQTRPASITYRHEQIAAVADMMGKLQLPPEAAQAATEVILEMVDLDPRVKERLLKALRPDPEQQAAIAQQQAQQQALQAQLTSMQMAKLEADIAKTQAEVERIRAQAETEMTAAVENTANANRLMADAAATQVEAGVTAQQAAVSETQSADVDRGVE